jgi:hypothetical protein
MFNMPMCLICHVIFLAIMVPFANLPAKTDLRTLAATIKARWICEQAHQQMKKNSVLITSRGDPGKAFTVMRL